MRACLARAHIVTVAFCCTFPLPQVLPLALSCRPGSPAIAARLSRRRRPMPQQQYSFLPPPPPLGRSFSFSFSFSFLVLVLVLILILEYRVRRSPIPDNLASRAHKQLFLVRALLCPLPARLPLRALCALSSTLERLRRRLRRASSSSSSSTSAPASACEAEPGLCARCSSRLRIYSYLCAPAHIDAQI